MDKRKLKYQLFDLSGEKFEELCHLLLKAEFGFNNAYILDIAGDEGVDIIAYKEKEKLAIQVKHKFQLDRNSLKNEIESLKHLLEDYGKVIFITSAYIDKSIINEFQTDRISIISQIELIKLLDKHDDISKRYFKLIEQKNKEIKRWLTTSLMGVIVSVLSALFTFMVDKNDEKPLAGRIDNVERALQNIKGLESDLEGIKEDMIKTDLENKRILEEYEKIQSLEKLINDKKESLSLVLNYQPWYKKLLNYIFGILTGIFSSIIASILWNKWKLNKSLKN